MWYEGEGVGFTRQYDFCIGGSLGPNSYESRGDLQSAKLHRSSKRKIRSRTGEGDAIVSDEEVRAAIA